MSLALYSEINLPQVEHDTEGLCAQLFDSLPRRIRHSGSFHSLRGVEDGSLSFIAISGQRVHELALSNLLSSIYIHTHIHTYIHTYIHIYIHIYIHTYIHILCTRLSTVSVAPGC